jgi:hypothetical protein
MLKTGSMLSIAIAAVVLPACLQDPDAADDPTSLGEDIGEKTGVNTSELDQVAPGEAPLPETPPGPRLNAGVFDVGVIPDRNVGCPAGADELVIRMDDEDDNNGSSRSGFIGKTNFEEDSENTRFYFCRVNGALFRPFSPASQASNLRDDYAVLKLGTTCPTGSQEFSRFYDNEDSGNNNFFNGVIDPNQSGSNTRLFFCIFRFASTGTSTQTAFPSLGTGFRYGVFAPADFNRAPLAVGRFRSDDEDSGNANTITAPSDALLAVKRIIEPDTAVSHGATIHHVIRAR